MTETPASSGVTQENGTRRSNGAGGSNIADHGANGSGAGSNGPDGNGAARYAEADLEPIQARLAAFPRGDFRPRGGPDDRHPAAAAGPLLPADAPLAARARRPPPPPDP